jgi:hypothetical protein
MNYDNGDPSSFTVKKCYNLSCSQVVGSQHALINDKSPNYIVVRLVYILD